MTSDNTRLLEFNQYQNSDKEPFTIYGQILNIQQKRLTDEHIPSGFLMSTTSLFKIIGTKHDVYIEVKTVCKRFMNP